MYQSILKLKIQMNNWWLKYYSLLGTEKKKDSRGIQAGSLFGIGTEGSSKSTQLGTCRSWWIPRPRILTSERQLKSYSLLRIATERSSKGNRLEIHRRLSTPEPEILTSRSQPKFHSPFGTGSEKYSKRIQLNIRKYFLNFQHLRPRNEHSLSHNSFGHHSIQILFCRDIRFLSRRLVSSCLELNHRSQSKDWLHQSRLSTITY